MIILIFIVMPVVIATAALLWLHIILVVDDVIVCCGDFGCQFGFCYNGIVIVSITVDAAAYNMFLVGDL